MLSDFMHIFMYFMRLVFLGIYILFVIDVRIEMEIELHIGKVTDMRFSLRYNTYITYALSS